MLGHIERVNIVAGNQPTTHLWARIQEWLDEQPFAISNNQLAKKLDDYVRDLTGSEAREVRGDLLTKWKRGDTPPTPAELDALVAVTSISKDVLLDAMLRDLGYRGRRAQVVGE